ncbi:SIMPL domain-containing protein [uncultured Methanofollis sp.]|uniref:SIMPL domain-containing protein n=1 Tax=uncultured Methanofollis sp. TaxID=262500 RepID=UPI00262CDE68|nr:SIMPL domain-containing protein [uncultured Methanofollis sp.]
MRTRTIFLCAALMVLLAAGVWSASAATDDTPDERLIHASGTGEVTTTPDRAVISVSVENEHTDPKEAQAVNAREMARVTDALKAAGIAPEDMKTTGYSIWPQYPENDKPFSSQRATYRVTNTLEVTLKDVNRAGEIVDLAVSNGANRVDNVFFTLSPEKEQQFRGEALTKAVQKARADADVVAAASGVNITGVQDISIGGIYVPFYENMQFRAMDAKTTSAAPQTPVETGTIKVTASVTVAYIIR